ncbi:MAG: MBL fold metallo-hydrolase [Sphaerochaetaceae bacterium]
MNLTFYGAARAVTGSCTLVQCAGKRILIDCGLAQGSDEKLHGQQLPFKASEIDYVVLTHAHIDHSGRLPLLVKGGFGGTIYCTKATEDLCAIMLADSGHIQEMEAQWESRKNIRAGLQEVEPLYTVEDARKTMDYFVSYQYEERFTIDSGIEAQFDDAGHLLGSASIQMWLTEETEKRHIVFSGDIGNFDQPLINDPVCLSEADFVVMESTYGDRLHPNRPFTSQEEATQSHSEELASIIRQTFAKGGNVVIPSFAVGRTQELLYLLRNIITKNMLPDIPHLPVFLDSPLAIEATNVFSKNIQGYFDQEAMALVEQGINPLLFSSLTTTVTAEESKALNMRKESAVIISASGMCEAGRIKHHLKHNLWRKESTILFCGYQAGGTLGRSILDGADRVTIFGEHIDVKASIQSLIGLSGHADQQGLLQWISCFKKAPRHVFVVHGGQRITQYFAGLLGSTLNLNAWAPEYGESFDLLADVLPVAEKEKRWISGLAELKSAVKQLDASFLSLQEVSERMHQHAKEAFADPSVRDAQRLSDAMARFASEIEKLKNRWNSPTS